VTADSLTYFRVDKHSVAQGNVKVYNKTDNITITGHRLDHWSERAFSHVTDRPVLVQVDSSGPGRFDTLVVRSREMEAYRDTVRLLVATDSVRIVRSDLAAVCGVARFYTGADSITLRTVPVVWYQDTQVTGDSINVHLKNRKLDYVDVLGNAFAISRGDSNFPERYDQLTGERMRMQFADKGLQQIDVETHAISLYHLYEDSLGNGLNRTSGDRILITFEEGKVASIRVVGGVEGKYYPENLVEGKESEFAIAGFRLHTNRPALHLPDTDSDKHSSTK
jgi:hypothetical protein